MFLVFLVSLVGYPPFTDEREDHELQQQILGGHFDFPDRFWAGIGESVKDLIRRLLTVDPNKRITIQVFQILRLMISFLFETDVIANTIKLIFHIMSH